MGYPLASPSSTRANGRRELASVTKARIVQLADGSAANGCTPWPNDRASTGRPRGAVAKRQELVEGS